MKSVFELMHNFMCKTTVHFQVKIDLIGYFS